MVSAPDWRELVRYLVSRKLSERRSLTIADMSASAYRYEPRPDRNVELREMICVLANRHKLFGVGMIYLKLSPCRARGEFQAGRTLVSKCRPSGTAALMQESPTCRTAATTSPGGCERGLVDGFRV